MTDQNQENQNSEGQSSQPQREPVYQGQPQTQGQSQYNEQAYSQQGNYGGNIPPQDQPNNYMAMSIVATVVGFLTCGACCISGILGIVAIVFSSQVNTKYLTGDLNGALNSASTAKTIGIVSLVLTALSFVGSIIYYAVLLTSGGMETFMEQYMEALEGMQ